MNMHTDTMTRVDARIPLAVRDTIDTAAALLGRTRTEFLISAALEKAEKTISEHALIHLSQRDQATLAAALQQEEISPPNKRMQALAQEYAQRVAK